MYTIQDLELVRWVRQHDGALLCALLTAGRHDLASEFAALFGTTLAELRDRARAEIARRAADGGPEAA
jgi:hypothetical protein